jgi:O-antigen/teichoic acid export membrane protein
MVLPTSSSLLCVPAMSRHGVQSSSNPTRLAAIGTLLHCGAQLWLTVCSYVVAVILARGLGPELYGAYGIIYSVLLGVELIGRFGIPEAVGKLIAESRDSSLDLVRTGMTLSLVLYLGIFALFWLCSPLMASVFHIPDSTALFRIASLDIPVYGMYVTCLHIVGGWRRFKIDSAAITIYASVKALGTLVLLYLGLSVRGALIINVMASVIGLTFIVCYVPLRGFRPSLSSAQRILHMASPIALLSLASPILLSLDIWIVGALLEESDRAAIGFYVAANSIARAPNIAFIVMMTVLVPSIAEAVARNDMQLVRRYVCGAIRFLSLTLVPVCALAALHAEHLMELLYSTLYTPGWIYLSILVISFLFYTFLMTFNAIFIAIGRPSYGAWITLALIPLGVFLDVVLILAHGPLGAAIATTAIMAIGAAVGAAILFKRFGSVVDVSALIKSGFAVAVISLIGWQLPSSGLMVLVELAALMGLYGVVLALAGIIGRDDLAQLIPNRAR